MPLVVGAFVRLCVRVLLRVLACLLACLPVCLPACLPAGLLPARHAIPEATVLARRMQCTHACISYELRSLPGLYAWNACRACAAMGCMREPAGCMHVGLADA